MQSSLNREDAEKLFSEQQWIIKSLKQQMCLVYSDPEKKRIQDLVDEYEDSCEFLSYYFLPEAIDYFELSNRLLNDAFANILLFCIHKSDEIQDAINSFVEEGIEIPFDKNNPYDHMVYRYGADKINRIIESKTKFSKYVISSLSDDEQLILDYEWVMEGANSVRPFSACCEDMGINPDCVKNIIETAFELPAEKLISAYESFNYVYNRSFSGLVECPEESNGTEIVNHA